MAHLGAKKIKEILSLQKSHGTRAVTERYNISESTLSRLKKKYEKML